MCVLGEPEGLTATAPRSTFCDPNRNFIFNAKLFVLAAPASVEAQTEIGPEGGTVADTSEFASSTTGASFERHRELRDAREQSAANLLDDPFARTRSSGIGRSADTPGASVAWLRRFAGTTPGVVGLIAFTVATLCVIAGLVCGAQLDRRIVERNAVLDRSEPFAYSAQNLYAALSGADAAAATEFLSAKETAPVRERYQRALARASSALADATAGSVDTDTRTAVAEMTAQLTAYTGLVESARANNLQGHVIGSAYLREASSLMQNTILPGAEEKIYDRNRATVDQNLGAISSTPTASLVLLGLTLAAIFVASLILFERTNRQFNVGLVTAAALVLVVGGWIVVATRLAAGDIEQGRTEGAAPFRQLAQARILAEKARTDETLELIAHGDITESEKSFDSHIDDLSSRLGAGPPEAVQGVRNWTASHRKGVDAYNNGDYIAAVEQAIGPDPAASAAQFEFVESSLRDAIERARATLRDRVSAAGDWLSWSPTGTLALMVVAATAAVAGLWPRLKEFQ